MIKNFKFVFVKPYESIGDIGLIVDFNKEEKKAKIATLDMDPRFSLKEVAFDDLMSLPSIVVKSILGDVSRSQKRYAYFIIMINSLGDASNYHIVENKEVQEIRNSLREKNCYIPCSTSKDIQYLLMKLQEYMDDKGIDAWEDEKFSRIASKYAITKESLNYGYL